MATGGCASVSHLSTPYSASYSAFSIKNILNLSEDTTKEHGRFPSGSEQANTYFSSSSPLVLGAEKPSSSNQSTCYPDFGIKFGRVPYVQAVAKMNHFPFSSSGSSFGMLNQGDKSISMGLLQRRRRRPLRKKKQRPLFSINQIQTMEREFATCQYVTLSRRAELAVELRLTETQVKTWFQNRRTKWKKERREKGELPSREVQSHCEGACGHSSPEGHFIHYMYSQQCHQYPIAWNAPNSFNVLSLKRLFSW